MRLTLVSGGCSGGSCPTVYATDRGTYVVQGYTVGSGEDAGLDVPSGEALVEVPAGLLDELRTRTQASDGGGT
ncbi:MAG: hypothetical protein M3387_01915 [Actinomycetota bacterium]|nr:hypothetical protein [Actinomycetota bacterium]